MCYLVAHLLDPVSGLVQNFVWLDALADATTTTTTSTPV